ncbi:hypothetical protein Salat_0049100 [Sesamum alatum]|uniref:Uncharacterized protein n=1 Tax=Sesamum alatum TaxID=300844 RepID=A0AAE1YW17_9LAMI|nr:hypothetical protein Salat_0049100 [Sesamum alatum]
MLRHIGSILEFVKEFSLLMLDVKDMFEEDKLLNFLDGLQPWIVMNDLDQGNDKEKFGKKFRKKEKPKEVVAETFEPRVAYRLKPGYFICGSTEHRMWQYSKCGKLNYLLVE